MGGGEEAGAWLLGGSSHQQPFLERWSQGWDPGCYGNMGPALGAGECGHCVSERETRSDMVCAGGVQWEARTAAQTLETDMWMWGLQDAQKDKGP